MPCEKRSTFLKPLNWRASSVCAIISDWWASSVCAIISGYREVRLLHPLYKLASPRTAFFLATFFSIGSYTSSPSQERLFFWPPFFQYNKRLLRQKTGGACLYMPQDGHWLASFEVIPPPKKLVFPRPKNENSPLKTVFLIQFFFENFGVLLSVRRKFCHAVLDSRDDPGLPPD